MSDVPSYSVASRDSVFVEKIAALNESIESLRASFLEKKYVLVKGFLRDPMPLILTNYAFLHAELGTTRSDVQVTDSKILYGDPLMDSILELGCPLIEEITGIQLYPGFTLCRIYSEGDALKPHTDRTEISASLTLGFDVENIRTSKPDYMWPIYLDGMPFLCEPGDLVIFRGPETRHWRDPFEGKYQVQISMHYAGRHDEPIGLKYDGRPFLGLPPCTRGAQNLKEAYEKMEKENTVDLVIRRLRQRPPSANECE
jgi:hypothetical protein